MKKMLTRIASLVMCLMLLSGCTLALAEEAVATEPAEVVEQAAAPEAETPAPEAETPAQMADWTLMIYLCGTDLETRGGMATTNLVEIAKTIPNDRVNVVIETGGTRRWQAEEELGLQIANDKLQRWYFGTEGYQLIEEQPLANMADYRTLTDFIQWSAQSYPAEKYMLVMWDHGGGSNGGLIVDELHRNAIMSLEDFGMGMANGGVHMEAIVLDTCLMGTLETAQALQPYANYLIASEEVVPGQGSAYQEWLQYLYDYPYVDGRQFGKVFCDAAQQKYAELNAPYYYKNLTFSAIDLNKLDPVVAAFENMFAEIGGMLADPEAIGRLTYLTKNAESFYSPEIVDLQDFATRANRYGLSLETVGAVIEAVNDAVVHNVKGLMHSYSHGLAFWYNPNATVDELDHFARNCKNPHYLAFLDAINMGWTAPAWVYEQVERLPDISREDYIPTYEVSLTDDGHLKLQITGGKDALARVDYRLLKQEDDESGQWISLGVDDEVEADWEEGTFWDAIDGMWPTLGKTPIQIRMLNSTPSYTLYDTPIAKPIDPKNIQFGYDKMSLRVGYEYYTPVPTVFDDMAQAASYKAKNEVEVNLDDEAAGEATDPYAGEYHIYGIWNQDSSNINMPSRDVIALDSQYGETFMAMGTYVDPLTQEESGEAPLGSFVLTEGIQIEEKPLPKGRYAYQFLLTDVFGNHAVTLPVPFNWDGKTVKFDMEYYEFLVAFMQMLGMM